MYDDSRNAVLMCLHTFLITVWKEKTEEEMRKSANTVVIASLDMEMMK